MLAVTPPDRMTDTHGRPYFLWDCNLTLAQFRAALENPDETIQAYMVGKLMRQAKPEPLEDSHRAPATIDHLAQARTPA